MQDLGNININIREFSQGGGMGGGPRPAGGGAGGGAGAGGGGGGGTGGGPATPPIAPPLPPNATPYARFQQMLTRTQGFLTGAGNIAGEIGGVVSRPSASGLVSLMSSSSATGSAIAALGAAALPVTLGLGALVIGAIALKKIWDLMAYSSERLLRRLDEVGRFSGAITSAQARETMAAFQRQIREATINGAAFAAVQRAATDAADAQAELNLQINSALAPLAILYQRIWKRIYELLTPFARLAAIITELSDKAGRFVSALYGKTGIGDLMQNDELRLAIASTRGLGALLVEFDTIVEYIEKILVYLGLIQAQTKPATGPSNVNDWFRADIAAVTHRRYGKI